MDHLTRQQKLDFIENQLAKLFCFSAEENIHYMQNLRNFPDTGLDVFLHFLIEAKEGQDKFFAKTLKRDPEFSKNFSRFLKQKTRAIQHQFEFKEQTSAESILKDI